MTIKSQIITASAGTGKTFTLINRILHLLLLNTPITKILVITFTNAAIQEIHFRLNKTFHQWQDISEKEIEIYKNQFQLEASPRELQIRAQQLLQEYIENIDQIQIKTIHSFASWILSHIAYDKMPKFRITNSINTNKLKINKDDMKKIMHFSKITEFIHKVIHNKYKFKNIKSEELSNKLHDLFFIDYKTQITELQDQIIKSYTQITQKSKTYHEIIDELYTQAMLLRKSKKLEEIQHALHDQITICEILINIHKTTDLFKIINNIIDQYEHLQQAYSALDYNDIIYKTSEILNHNQHVNTSEHNYYLYAIYVYFDHILIDEAQDTSIIQWQILSTLINEIAHSENKSFFIVGDAKQSIFSFQGSQVESLENIILKYQNNKNIETVQLTRTYRNAENIVSFVNKIFANLEFFPYQESRAIHPNGIVKAIKCEKSKSHQNEWPLINGYKTHVNAKVLSIYKIIQDKISEGNKYSDIMIIVQKRNKLFFDIISFLQYKNIPCQNPDKESLSTNEFVEHMIYLVEIILNPHNDFAALKIIKMLNILPDQTIEHICKAKKQESLFNTIKLHYPNIFSFFVRIQEEHKSKTYEHMIFFLIDIVSQHIPTNKNIINAFLDVVYMHYSIYDLIQYLYNHNIDAKIPTNTQDQVSLLTSHGSKGLESKIIILADTTMTNKTNLQEFIWLSDQMFFWNNGLKGSVFNEIKSYDAKDKYKEYIRLLYVAITRARDEFYAICDEDSQRGSWSDLILSNTNNILTCKDEIVTTIPVQYHNRDTGTHSLNDIAFQYQACTTNANITNKPQEYGVLLHAILNKALQYIIQHRQHPKSFKSFFNNTNRHMEVHVTQQIKSVLNKSRLLQNISQNTFLEHKAANGTHSYVQIDAITIKEDSVDIIDFKLEYIDNFDRSYKKQLNQYSQIVSSYFPNHKINKYILCLTTCREIAF